MENKKATHEERERISHTDESEELPEDLSDPDAPRRLVDELVAYVSRRQQTREAGGGAVVDEEHLIRTVLRHLRRNPVPAALLGFSLSWLLLAGDREEEEEDSQKPDLGYQVEEEVLQQLRGGFRYTQDRLREVVDRYPWGAAAAMIGGGLLAAFLLPERRSKARSDFIEHEIGEEPIAGEGFDFEEPEEGGEEYR